MDLVVGVGSLGCRQRQGMEVVSGGMWKECNNDAMAVIP